jgi:hypothetical protein
MDGNSQPAWLFQTAINLGVTTDFMPQMGPMVGWAVMLQIEPS